MRYQTSWLFVFASSLRLLSLISAYDKNSEYQSSFVLVDNKTSSSASHLRALESQRMLGKKTEKQKKTNQPVVVPTPTMKPVVEPSNTPSIVPSSKPSLKPSVQPSSKPSVRPSSKPSKEPSSRPSSKPSQLPSRIPSSLPSNLPSVTPSLQPSDKPSMQPSMVPSKSPSASPIREVNNIEVSAVLESGLLEISGSTRPEDDGKPFSAVPRSAGVTYCGTSITSLVRYYSIGGKNETIVSAKITSSDFDVKLSVFKGSFENCIGGLDDDIFIQETNPTIAWESVTGQRYLLLVHGFMSEMGTFKLHLTISNVPSSSFE